MAGTRRPRVVHPVRQIKYALEKVKRNVRIQQFNGSSSFLLVNLCFDSLHFFGGEMMPNVFCPQIKKDVLFWCWIKPSKASVNKYIRRKQAFCGHFFDATSGFRGAKLQP